MLDQNLIDQLMFSINPAYDFESGDYANGSPAQRHEMYRRCEELGVGITVMKPLAGGTLIDEKRTPLSRPLTVGQCVEYALVEQPGVLCVVSGIASQKQGKELLDAYEEPAADKELPDHLYDGYTKGVRHCVCCSHCHPCPAGLNIALINKYYDLARAGDDMAADHYMKLEKHAEDCVQCGHCSSRCPFHTDPMNRMMDIKEYFGK